MGGKTTQAPTLKLERIFNATPEKLWEYWVDPKKYAKWLNPAGIDLVIHKWDARVGGEVRFDMPQPDGNPNPQSGVFHKLDPHKEIVTGDADKSFLLHVRFEPISAKMTRMTVTATGVPEEWHAPARIGWNQGFDQLETLIGADVEASASTRRGGASGSSSAGSALPKVAADAPNQGFVIERTFRAKPERVWQLWTTKEGLDKWWSLSAKDMGYAFRVVKLDVRVGGAYDIELKDEKVTLHNHGTYTTVQPYTKLAWTWRYDIFLAPGETPYDVAISVELEPVAGGGTRMTFRQGPLASPEFTEGSRQGVLANFKKLDAALLA